MSIFLMDDRPTILGGTRGAALVALRSSAFGGLRLGPELLVNRAQRSSNEMLIKRSALNALKPFVWNTFIL